MLTRFAAALGVVFALAAPALAQSFELKDGDRVVFYGDSITEQDLYTAYVETFVVTRFPGLDVRFTNSGWSSDRVTGGFGGKIDVRLERDVIAHAPTVVTIMLGMNDGNTAPFAKASFDKYSRGLEHIVDTLAAKTPKARVTLCEPSPYDDVTHAPQFPGGYNATLVRYGAFVRELAARRGLRSADLNAPVVAALTKAFAKDEALARKIIPGRVHPAPAGHVVMAAAVLKAWNAPSLVASVEIDGAKAKLVRAQNADVAGLALNDGALAWDELDRALPFPLAMHDAAFALAVRSSDVVALLDQEPLRVTGLAADRYRLSIDGKAVATLTRDDLAKGVNLALLETPMAEQAAAVHALTRKHNSMHYTRWRNVELAKPGELTPDVKKKLGDLDAQEAEVVKEQRARAKPVKHRFELAPTDAPATPGIVSAIPHSAK